MADEEKKKEVESPEEEEGSSHSHAAEHDDSDNEDDVKFVPGKQVGLKEQLEMDKDDESLRKWKEQLLGNLSIADEGKLEPEVEFQTMSIVVEGRDAIQLPIPKKGETASEPAHFVLKEKSVYRLQFEFTVRNEIVLGLTYLNRVFRLGAQVDKERVMMGTYGPQKEPYQFVTEEETTPHGLLARGKYSAKTTFTDDDGKTHLEFDYTFEIKKDW